MEIGKDTIKGENVSKFDCEKMAKIQEEIINILLNRCSCYMQAQSIVQEVQYSLYQLRMEQFLL